MAVAWFAVGLVVGIVLLLYLAYLDGRQAIQQSDNEWELFGGEWDLFK